MKDWGEISEIYEQINKEAFSKNLENESEAQTRFDIIDRLIKEVLQWQHGQISIEPHTTGIRDGYIDYLLISGDKKIIVEAKKVGATFPSPTKKRKLKLTGAILGKGAINEALLQAEDYAINKNADVVVATNGNCCVSTHYQLKQSEIQFMLRFYFHLIKLKMQSIYLIFLVARMLKITALVNLMFLHQLKLLIKYFTY